MENTQPGQVITPGATIEPVAPPPPQAVSPVSEPVPQASPVDAPQPVAPAVDMTPPLPALPQQPYPQEPLPPTPSVAPAIPEATPFPAQNTPMESFTPSPEVVPQSQEVDLQWVASEPPHGHKDATWYGVFVLAAIVLSALVYLFTRDIVSTGAWSKRGRRRRRSFLATKTSVIRGCLLFKEPTEMPSAWKTPPRRPSM